MSCSGCSSSDNRGLPKGCNNNGSCGTTLGCNKLDVFDWLANMEENGSRAFPWLEVRFKNTRKAFYYNKNNLTLSVGDVVAVETQTGHDIGEVSAVGSLARLQMKKYNINLANYEKNIIFRHARENDIQKWQEAIAREKDLRLHARIVAKDLKLDMKISDVECQGDGSKATFYYTADSRVDFRELIKTLAQDFKLRIEMRQIGLRQEAGRLGGIGSCGRELCCSTWLTDFRSVSTSAARYQQLSLNPQKLAGQCGKLKCCLNYELDSYLDALQQFPKGNVKLKTRIGDASLQKTDIFKQVLYYSYDASPEIFVPMHLASVKQVIELNGKGELVDDLSAYAIDTSAPVAGVEKKIEFSNVVEEDSINRFDKALKNKKKKKNNRNKRKPANKKNEA